METNNVTIIRVVEWITPYFGNKHFMPYGKLEVTDGQSSPIPMTNDNNNLKP